MPEALSVEWISAISELIGSVAWPATVLLLVILFRREIRQRLKEVKEVKYPGGSISMLEVEQLSARVEASGPPALETPADESAPSLPFTDPKLAIAQGRIDVERELFRLSWRVLGLSTVTNWHTVRHIDELENAEVIPHQFAENVRSFFDVANRVLHGSEIPTEVVTRTAAIAGDLLATLRHKRLVHEAQRDFEGHLLWHMHGRLKSRQQRYYLMSAVAAQMPEFGYSYDVYRDALELFNSRQRSERPPAPGGEIPVLTLEEFLEALECREAELERVRRELPQVNWDDKENDVNYWKWPAKWGDLEWSCPILRDRVSQFNAEQEIMQTRAALDRYRARLLAEKRRSGNATV